MTSRASLAMSPRHGVTSGPSLMRSVRTTPSPPEQPTDPPRVDDLEIIPDEEPVPARLFGLISEFSQELGVPAMSKFGV